MKRCFVCGKEDKLTDGKCKECYLKESFQFSIPGRIKVPYCKSCNSYYTNRWKNLDNKLSFIDEVLKNNISSSREIKFVSEFSKDNKDIQAIVDFLDEGNIYKVKITIRPFYDDSLFDMEASSEILLSGEQCQRCSRFYGGYYEAILQIRNDEKKIELERANDIMKIVDKFTDKLILKDRMAFISRIEELKEGIDIYMGSLSAARKIGNCLIKKFNGSMGESHKLMGIDRDSGKKIYRTTVTVRLKNRAQRYAYYKNHLYLLDIAGDNFKLTSLEGGNILSIKAKEFERELKKENMKVIEKDILETVDISVTEVTPERYQMMKLSGDYETFYVLRDEVRLKGIKSW